jgi:hypothetical protein
MAKKLKVEANQAIPQDEICWIHSRRMTPAKLHRPGVPPEPFWSCTACVQAESAVGKNSWDR